MHRIIAPAIALLLAACSSPAPKQPAPQPEPPVAQTETESESARSLRIALAHHEAIDKRDIDSAATHMAEDLEYRVVNAVAGPATSNKQRWIERSKLFLGAIPKAKSEVLVALASGDRSAVLYRNVTGAGVTWIRGDVNEHDDEGRIRGLRDYGDPLTVLHQLGIRSSKDAPDAEPAWGEPVATAAAGDDREKAAVATAEKLFVADEQKDVDAAMAVVTDDISFRIFASKRPLLGADAFRKMLEWRKANLETSHERLSMWAAGDWVVAEFRTTHTPKDPAQKPTTGHVLSFSQMRGEKIAKIYFVLNGAHLAVEEGKLTAADLEADFAKAMAKFGLTPPKG